MSVGQSVNVSTCLKPALEIWSKDKVAAAHTARRSQFKIRMDRKETDSKLDIEEEETAEERIDRGDAGITKSYGGPAGPPRQPEVPLGQKPGAPVPIELDNDSRV
jgi:hypothetical protein